jgi:hypothetical protein
MEISFDMIKELDIISLYHSKRRNAESETFIEDMKKRNKWRNYTYETLTNFRLEKLKF